ncbi:hypothetical protein ABQD56_09765 [Vagococcus fluvialis]|uniref:hypothetical protein n=1 Tax=Vagococcus fluvialis TaxID=2738 RepID=UPI0032E4922C
MDRIFKFISFIAISFFIFAISVSVINLIFEFLKILNITSSEDSLINDLTKINYVDFYRIGFVCLLVFSAILSIVNMVLMFTISESASFEILVPLLKISLALSIVIPMVFVLTKEQFNVITSLVSFLALFSFLVPKKFFKKSKKE